MHQDPRDPHLLLPHGGISTASPRLLLGELLLIPSQLVLPGSAPVVSISSVDLITRGRTDLWLHDHKPEATASCQ